MKTKVCQICNTEYQVHNYRFNKSKFCSNDCHTVFKKQSGIKPPARTGASPWNKGLTKKDDERINKIGFKKGKDNPVWNNGSSTFKDKHKRKWKRWREAVFKRDNYTCQECGKRGVELHPHHIKCFAHHSKLRFEVSNGLTLCTKCHEETDTYGQHKCS